MYHLIFHSLVQIDIDEAYNWYEDKLAGLGEQFLQELDIHYNKLENQPQFYGETMFRYRKAILDRFPYIIVFKILDETVVVFAVFHTSRNPKEFFKRK